MLLTLNSPWQCVFRSPIQASLHMSGRLSATEAGTDPERGAALLTSPLFAFSFTIAFLLSLEFLSLSLLYCCTTLSLCPAERDMHNSFDCVVHMRYEASICLAWVGAS